MQSTSASSSNQSTSNDNSLMDEKVKFSNEVNEQYERLRLNWGEINPSYYAGAYISDSDFYISVTCEPSSVQENIFKITGNPKIKIQKVKYTYDELETIKDNLIAKISSLSSEGDKNALQFVGFGVNEIKNKVFVEVLDNGNIDKDKIFDMIDNKELVDVIFKSEAYKAGASTNINAGQKDWVVDSTLGLQSTIGFCANRVNSQGVTEKGFVMAGHAANLYDAINISSTRVGTGAARLYEGKCDAAFVNLDVSSNYVQSKILSSSYTIDGTATVGVVGTTYNAHGMKSGIKSGTVDNTSFSFKMDGIQFTDHIRMKIGLIQGDSGGPLVKTNSGSSQYVLGIYSGGDGTYDNFTKFSNIASSFNLTLYK